MDVNLEILQANSQATYGLDFPGGLRRATGLNLDPNGICRTLWGKELNACYPELVSLVSGRGITLPGGSGNYISTPDHATLDITGDIDLQWEGYTTNFGQYIAKWTTGGDQRSYRMFISFFTTLHGSWSTAGTNASVLEANFLSGLNPAPAVRVTLDVDNGSSQRVITFYGAESIEGPWSIINQQTIAGVTSIFSGSAPLTIGAQNAGTADVLAGRFKRARVYNGIMGSGGTLVADPDARNLAPGATSFIDSTGKTWTIHGSAAVA